jgi:protein-disulfide isomerase
MLLVSVFSCYSLLFCLAVPFVFASPSADEEIQTLRREVEGLKQGQAAIQKDLEEIKKLLQEVRQASRPAPARLPVEPVDFPVKVDGRPQRGSAEAKVVLIEFSEFQCPFCARHATQTMPELDRDYIETGKVKYVFRDLPLQFHPHAAKAAEAAHCAGEQGKYWEMSEHLLANQRTLAPEHLPGHAEKVGLDVEKFKACLESGKFESQVKEDVAEAGRVGITGTPSFLLAVVDPQTKNLRAVTRIRGAQPLATFRRELDKLLGPQADDDED